MKRKTFVLVAALLVVVSVVVVCSSMGSKRSVVEGMGEEGRSDALIDARDEVRWITRLNTNHVYGMTQIVLIGVVTNGGTNVASFNAAGVFSGCRLVVVDATNGVVAHTSWGRKVVKSMRDTGVGEAEVRPGKWREIRIPVNQLYDMSEGGRYRVTASIMIGMYKGKKRERIELSGEPLEVTVSPPRLGGYWDNHRR